MTVHVMAEEKVSDALELEFHAVASSLMSVLGALHSARTAALSLSYLFKCFQLICFQTSHVMRRAL